MKDVNKIFIVDENHFFPMLMEKCLKELYTAVVQVFDEPKECISSVLTEKPSVIIVDYCFYRKNKFTVEGLTAKKIIMNLEDHQHVYVLYDEKYLDKLTLIEKKLQGVTLVLKDRNCVDFLLNEVHALLPDMGRIAIG